MKESIPEKSLCRYSERIIYRSDEMHNDKYLYKTICEVVPHATTRNKEYIYRQLEQRDMWRISDIESIYYQLTTGE